MRKFFLALPLMLCVSGCANMAPAIDDLTKASQQATTIAPQAAQTASTVVNTALSGVGVLLDVAVGVLNFASEIKTLF